MFDYFIMASKMVAIVEENKRQRILSELDQYDPKVVATIKETFMKMADGENLKHNITLIFIENKSEEFRTQFTDLTEKFGYFVVPHSSNPNALFLSATPPWRKK